MKRLIGWSLFVGLVPVMLVGAVSYLVWSALAYGWSWVESCLNDWNE